MPEPVVIRVKLQNGWGIQVLSSDPEQTGREWLEKLGKEFSGIELVHAPNPIGLWKGSLK